MADEEEVVDWGFDDTLEVGEGQGQGQVNAETGVNENEVGRSNGNGDGNHKSDVAKITENVILDSESQTSKVDENNKAHQNLASTSTSTLTSTATTTSAFAPDPTTPAAAPGVTEPQPPLPSGWTSILSRSTGRYFYYHEGTKTTVWDRPTESTLNKPPTPPIVSVSTPTLAPAPAPAPAPASAASEPKEDAPLTHTQDVVKVDAAPASTSGEMNNKDSVTSEPVAVAVAADPPKETAAPTSTDNVASAYSARRVNKPSGSDRPTSIPSRPSRFTDARDQPQLLHRDHDRGGKRSSDVPLGRDHRRRSPPPAETGENDVKRFKSSIDDNYNRRPTSTFADQRQQRRSPPSRSNYDKPQDSHSRRAFARSPPPPLQQTRYRNDAPDSRSIGMESRYQSANSRIDDRSRPPRSPSRAGQDNSQTQVQIARGPNSAPIPNSRWGASDPVSASASGQNTPSGPLAAGIPTASGLANANLPSRPMSTSETAEEKRARLREEARKAQEVLKAVQEEEAKLELEEAERKKKEKDEQEKEKERIQKVKAEEEEERRRKRDDRAKLPLSARVGPPPPRDDRDRGREYGRGYSPPRAMGMRFGSPPPPQRRNGNGNGSSYTPYNGPSTTRMSMGMGPGRRPDHIAEPMSDRDRGGWQERPRERERERERRNYDNQPHSNYLGAERMSLPPPPPPLPPPHARQGDMRDRKYDRYVPSGPGDRDRERRRF